MTSEIQVTSVIEAQNSCAPAEAATRLSFCTVPFDVEVHRCGKLAGALRTILPDWTFSEAFHSPDDRRPYATITRTDNNDYQFHSWWSRRPMGELGLAGASCGVVADVVQAFLDAHPGMFGLHCGAVRLGGHLVAFTGRYRSGKTTLVTRLSAEPGFELFCDDVLPIEPDGSAMALGVQPRLRLPLPPNTSRDFRAFAENNLTVHDKRYGFVSTPNQASYGTRAPLAALVVLSRSDEGPARFHEISTSEAAACLIRQNIADPGEIESHYDKVTAMARDLPSVLLTYSDLEEAVALVRKAFCSEGLLGDNISVGPPQPATHEPAETKPADLSECFARSENIIERIIGTDTFLWQMDDRQFFRLNPIGGAVWALLEKPCSGLEIKSTLVDLFPDVEAHVIGTDLSHLLGQMLWRGVVEFHGYADN